MESFHKKGYLLVPGVLTTQEIAIIRKRILDIFGTGEWKKSPYNTPTVLSEVYTYFPELIDLTLKSKVLDTIKSLLGNDPILMPETAVHKSFYTGWHKDTSMQEKEGHHFHKKPEFLMVEAGFYLQDNDEWGGGLTVMEGSHTTPDTFLANTHYDFTFFERLKRKLLRQNPDESKRMNPYGHPVIDIPSKAGDLVIFNFKTNHRATRPLNEHVNRLPKDKTKLAFFNAFSSNNPTAVEYLEYIKSRTEPYYQNLRSGKLHDAKLLAKGTALGFTIF